MYVLVVSENLISGSDQKEWACIDIWLFGFVLSHALFSVVVAGLTFSHAQPLFSHPDGFLWSVRRHIFGF